MRKPLEGKQIDPLQGLLSSGAMRPATKARLKQLGYPSYAAYLRSPHWLSVRKKYLASGLPMVCYVCGTDQQIVLHHIDYLRIGAEDIRRDLIPLCKTCHRGVHSYMKAHRVRVESAHVAYRKWIVGGRPPKLRRKRR